MAPPLAAAEVAATSKIDAVTVFPSGAEITRYVIVKLEKGENTIVLGDLTPYAMPSSIRVEGKATGKLEIGSVDSRRLFVPRGDVEAAGVERKRIEDEIEKLRDERLGVEAQIEAAQTQKMLIANLTQLPTRPVPQAGTAGVVSEDWRQVLALIASGMTDASKVVLESQIKLREIDRKIIDLEKKIGELEPPREERTEIKVFATAEEPLEADLTIRYQVANASWQPYYDARLSTGTKTEAPKLELVRRAAISQESGESWTDVVVQLSTSRPAAGSAAPVLYSLNVDFEPESKPKPMRFESRDKFGGTPAPITPMDSLEANQETDMGEPELAAAETRKEIAEKSVEVAAASFQAVFAVPGRLTVLSTGEAKRVLLGRDQIETSLLVRTVPKADPKGYLYAKIVGPKGAPLLSGAVSLFRDGTFAGSGTFPILAPGEDHELGFGVDDLVRVKFAAIEDKRGETGLISTSRTDDRSYRITIKNTHERAMPVTVLDQVPVSKNDTIKVELVSKPAPTKRDVDDKRGVISWELTIPPGAEEIIETGWRTTWPSEKAIQYGR